LAVGDAAALAFLYPLEEVLETGVRAAAVAAVVLQVFRRLPAMAVQAVGRRLEMCCGARINSLEPTPETQLLTHK
jgi:hypothetical protein